MKTTTIIIVLLMVVATGLDTIRQEITTEHTGKITDTTIEM